ncbi:MAG: type III pantothenate kinase, partial [Chloroflexi bacterium]|nr:type III pantothenate kinase [Chloroflexota bacterium]
MFVSFRARRGGRLALVLRIWLATDARLPRIDVRKPAAVVGRTTISSMESGLFYGYVGMVEGLVRRMSDELGGRTV